MTVVLWCGTGDIRSVHSMPYNVGRVFRHGFLNLYLTLSSEWYPICPPKFSPRG